MKHAVAYFLFFISCSTTGFSQDNPFKHNEYGIKAGGYICPVYVVDSLKPVNFNGTLAGIRFLHFEEKNAALLVELNYNRLSYKHDGKSFTYDHIQVPFLAHFYLPMNRVSLTINMGTYGMFLLSKDERLWMDRNFLYGLSGGGGLNFSINKFLVGIESRYYFNLHSNNRDDETMRSKWLELSLILNYRGVKVNKKSDLPSTQ